VETARLAEETDLDALVSLWERAVADLDGHRGGALLAGSLVRSDIRAFVEHALTDRDRVMAIGSLDGVPVGIASAFADRQRREAIGAMELIYVDPNARQVGVAEAMLELIWSWCATLRLAGLDAPALPGNRAAKAFFESHGFLARLLVMHRSLDVANESGAPTS
jgi:GNAT superfamily N-acetyltransferase